MFEKLESFTKDVSDLADRPALSSTELKNQFDAAPNEVREYLNRLIDALKKTESGDSGAKNIGVSAIQGLTGTDIQTILEQLAPKKLDAWANAATQNGWYNFVAGMPAQYYKDPFGIVHLRGRLAPGSLTNGVTPFVLPEGFRPAKEVDIMIKAFNPQGYLSPTTLVINPSGNCSLYDNLSLSSIRLDNIHFRTDS